MDKKDARQQKNPKKNNAPQLGHFLDYNRHWLQAVDLLEYQLDRKKTNRHFWTLEMSYYERLRESFDRLRTKRYFNSKVANNLFYGLSKEFAVIPYTIPKSNLGLRRYKFMACPMRVLYYAVGIYLLELSKDYLKESHCSQDRISARYGGKLGLNDEGKLIRKPDRIYYKSQYDKFCRRVKKENDKDTERKVVIRLDIENYFDELSIPKLLALLQDRVDDDILMEMNYDEIAHTELISFFDFVASGKSGIPQSDNNIISDFIGNLFLVFADLYLDDELCKSKDSVENHAIIRYVDDIYISITFKEEVGDFRPMFNPQATRISDCLYSKLGLRLNPKTKIFRLKEKGDRAALEHNLKMVSRDDDTDEKNTESPAKTIQSIFKQLDKLKRFPIAPHFHGHHESHHDEKGFNEEKFKEVLKGAYDRKVERMLIRSKRNYRARLREIFLGPDGFDFELVNAYPMPIIILILTCDDVSEKFQEFLRQKKPLTSSDIHLVLRYLCQIEFKQKKLINLLKRSPDMSEVMKIFKRKGLPSKSLGYYELTKAQISKIAEPHIIEQIKLRVLREQKGEYSVALSHLYNEFHAICHSLDINPPPLKSYQRPKVEKFLRTRNVPSDTKAQVLKLIARRHKDTVSHADPIAWAVTKETYLDYRSHVGDCLKHLL